MSSHTLDLSGQRPANLLLNDPAVTRFSTSAKQGDDTEFSFGGREVRIALPSNARVQSRIVPTKVMRRDEGGAPMKDAAGEYLYDDGTEYRLVLVLSSVSGFVRSSLTPDERAMEDGAEGKPTYEAHTHTSTTVRRKGDEDWHYLEAGEIEVEFEIGELLRDRP